MNYKMIFKSLGYVLLTEGVMLILPLIVALIYSDFNVMLPIIATIAVLLFFGFSFISIKIKNTVIFAKDGFIIVALSWILVSLFGAIPFYLSGYIPSFVDAFFETVSGFTTTGSSILTDVEALPHSLLFWRSFTHWIGGMGVLVFIMTMVPLAFERSMHVMRAEVPGPVVGKLVPKMKDTAKLLYRIYIVMTAIMIVFLLIGGMPLFDSLLTAFATAGTGGFAIKSASIAYYDSVYIEMVVAIFMLLFGINFNLYYFLLVKDYKNILKNEELRWYIGIIAVSVLLISLNTVSMMSGFTEALRHSFFSVSSVITTTGFCTADFNTWPSFSKMILLCLMYLGACAGSTGGGLKISRLIILLKGLYAHIIKLVHPRAVRQIRLDGNIVDEKTENGTMLFFVAYVAISFAAMLIISLDGADMETTISSVAACIGNIGPGLGLTGPTGNFAFFSDLSKIVLSFVMLIGRLEIFPILLLIIPSTYRKNI